MMNFIGDLVINKSIDFRVDPINVVPFCRTVSDLRVLAEEDMGDRCLAITKKTTSFQMMQQLAGIKTNKNRRTTNLKSNLRKKLDMSSVAVFMSTEDFKSQSDQSYGLIFFDFSKTTLQRLFMKLHFD